MIRKAVAADIPAVVEIYNHILDREEAGEIWVGWRRGVYPTEQTARAALEDGELYVCEEDGRVAAAARINDKYPPEYDLCPWKFEAREGRFLVLHTLVVEPALSGRGLGSAFVRFYEDLARSQGCSCVRMDTGPGNRTARALYARLGYREAAVLPCVFEGIPNAMLVCLEKKLV